MDLIDKERSYILFERFQMLALFLEIPMLIFHDGGGVTHLGYSELTLSEYSTTRSRSITL